MYRRPSVLIGSPAYRQRLPRFMTFLRTPVIGAAGLRFFPPTRQVERILELAYYDARKIFAARKAELPATQQQRRSGD